MVKDRCNICGGTGIDRRTYPPTECTHCSYKGDDDYEHDFDLSFKEFIK